MFYHITNIRKLLLTVLYIFAAHISLTPVLCNSTYITLTVIPRDPIGTLTIGKNNKGDYDLSDTAVAFPFSEGWFKSQRGNNERTQPSRIPNIRDGSATLSIVFEGEQLALACFLEGFSIQDVEPEDREYRLQDELEGTVQKAVNRFTLRQDYAIFVKPTNIVWFGIQSTIEEEKQLNKINNERQIYSVLPLAFIARFKIPGIALDIYADIPDIISKEGSASTINVRARISIFQLMIL